MNLKISSILFCLLIFCIQCTLSGIRVSPEIINCAEDELPSGLQAIQKQERIIFSVLNHEGIKPKTKAFDMSRGTIQDIFVDLQPVYSDPVLSPSGTYMIFPEYL